MLLQVFFNLLSVLMMRHSSALLPTWQSAVDAAGDRGRPLQQQLAAVTAAGSGGDARLKAYVSLLLALMNTATQVGGPVYVVLIASVYALFIQFIRCNANHKFEAACC